MARGESSFVAIEAEGTAVVRSTSSRARAAGAAHRDRRRLVFVGLGDPVQESVARGYEDAFSFLIDEHGWSAGDATRCSAARTAARRPTAARRRTRCTR